MTKRMSDYYVFIRNFIYKNGYSPTHTEIAAGVGISSRGTTKKYIDLLVNKGLIKINKKTSRNIELVNNNDIKKVMPSYFKRRSNEDLIHAKTALVNIEKIVKNDSDHYLYYVMDSLKLYCEK